MPRVTHGYRLDVLMDGANNDEAIGYLVKSSKNDPVNADEVSLRWGIRLRCNRLWHRAVGRLPDRLLGRFSHQADERVARFGQQLHIGSKNAQTAVSPNQKSETAVPSWFVKKFWIGKRLRCDGRRLKLGIFGKQRV
ncbi:MAG: hypothetical protein R3D55_07780 [Chloroflexota bacterium]